MNKDWLELIKENYDINSLDYILNRVDHRRKSVNIYPPKDEVFSFLKLTPFDNIKVVIIGQDPYHQPGQANGLAFSVKDGIIFPPSLRNIFKELQDDLGCDYPTSGDLTPWARQGVFLINSTLTVEEGNPNSHSSYGWQTFTDFLIEYISQEKEDVVFVLLGKFAQLKKNLIDTNKHFIIETSHPSPFSARKGFSGSNIFSSINEYLSSKNITTIDWRLR